jgi:hypothetical protein
LSPSFEIVGPAGVQYEMVTLNAHFDGKVIVPDEPSSLTVPAGTRLRISVETVDDTAALKSLTASFQPLDIHVDPDVSHSIALDPEFNIEES